MVCLTKKYTRGLRCRYDIKCFSVALDCISAARGLSNIMAFRAVVSVTRFVEISPLWKFFKSLGQIVQGTIFILLWQKFDTIEQVFIVTAKYFIIIRKSGHSGG